MSKNIYLFIFPLSEPDSPKAPSKPSKPSKTMYFNGLEDKAPSKNIRPTVQNTFSVQNGGLALLTAKKNPPN